MLISPANAFNIVNKGLWPALTDRRTQGMDQMSIG